MQLDTAQRGAIRCSAAFAIVAERQRQGDADALESPPLGERGREFFVRVGARLFRRKVMKSGPAGRKPKRKRAPAV